MKYSVIWIRDTESSWGDLEPTERRELIRTETNSSKYYIKGFRSCLIGDIDNNVVASGKGIPTEEFITSICEKDEV